MNSPKANLFLAIQAYIASLADGSGNPYFAMVDQDFGQMKVRPRPPVSFPCVLIDMDTFKYEKLGLDAQSGEGAILIKMCFTPYSSAGSITPSTYQDSAIYYYDLEEYLHQALQGWSPGDQAGYSSLQNIYGVLYRIADQTEPSPDGFIRIRQITYKITMEDYSTQISQLTAASALNLTDEIAP